MGVHRYGGLSAGIEATWQAPLGPVVFLLPPRDDKVVRAEGS